MMSDRDSLRQQLTACREQMQEFAEKEAMLVRLEAAFPSLKFLVEESRNPQSRGREWVFIGSLHGIRIELVATRTQAESGFGYRNEPETSFTGWRASFLGEALPSGGDRFEDLLSQRDPSSIRLRNAGFRIPTYKERSPEDLFRQGILAVADYLLRNLDDIRPQAQGIPETNTLAPEPVHQPPSLETPTDKASSPAEFKSSTYNRVARIEVD